MRYTGVTLGYQIGAALAGGTAPLLCTFLLARFDGSWVPIALYIAAIAVLSIIAVSFAPKVARADDSIENPATEHPETNHDLPGGMPDGLSMTEVK
ncbi:hypothetical protein [Arthrobacter sp. JCM 19049]|uniref:hypothetical protein n=1 Tax=Arthrobacter sp. JCM 19049 TaxID=1460643 RepID=UPI000A589EEC|nr:hypothetical protein [Arthrobacter sp. JCM 19049]